ncbi:MAG: hypothetical protein ACREDQ_05680, partial [Limisphaerales bacterium]
DLSLVTSAATSPNFSIDGVDMPEPASSNLLDKSECIKHASNREENETEFFLPKVRLGQIQA